MHIAAILVAAGQGARMGGNVPKALLSLGGRPLLLHAFETLAALPNLCSITVVVGSDHVDTVIGFLEHHASPQLRVVSGGTERQDSVAAGLVAIDPSAQLVLVHDAARPFVTRACVLSCIDAAIEHGAAIVALPAHDTIKHVDERKVIDATLDRSQIWLAQTPQVFRSDWLRAAFARAAADGVIATDEAGLLERCGYAVRVVPGEPTNRKLTTPEDMQWAEWFLKRSALR